MKVTKLVHPEPVEMEIDIGEEDIAAALSESPDAPRTALLFLNTIAQTLSAIAPEIIAQMTSGQRETVAAFLSRQVLRFQ